MHALAGIHVGPRFCAGMVIYELLCEVAEECLGIQGRRQLRVADCLLPIEVWVRQVKPHIVAGIEQLIEQRTLQQMRLQAGTYMGGR
jgi:hypothetical protein